MAVGLIAGCTAIIDGAQELPNADQAPSYGSQSATGDAVISASGNAAAGDATATAGNGGQAEVDVSAGGAENGGALGAAGGATTTSSGGEGGRLDQLGGAGAGGRTDAAGAPSNGGVSSGGGQNAGGTGGNAGSSSAGGGAGGTPPLTPGDPVKGHQLVILDNCTRCHGDNLAGRSFYRNITPDIETGIGAWTDKQIATAVRGAVGPTGELFCATMPLYSGLKDQEVADLIAYLRLVPAVKNLIVPVCPGHNP